MNKRSIASAVFVCSLAFACDSPTGTGPSCPSTGEFGSYGCAIVSVQIEYPSQPLPYFYSLSSRVSPARAGTGVLDSGFQTERLHGDERISENLVTVTRYSRPDAGSQDTASFWVVTSIRQMPESTLFAIDSVLRVLRFAPVNGRMPVDTVVTRPVVK